MPGKAPPASLRADPRLGQAQMKGLVLPVPGHHIGHCRGQHRRVPGDHHLDALQPL